MLRSMLALVAAVAVMTADAALQNVAERIRGDTDARRRVRTALATAAAKEARGDRELVGRAIQKWTPAGIRKQTNREAIAARVLENLADDPPPADVAEAPTNDFMNLFEDVAERASSLRPLWTDRWRRHCNALGAGL